MKYADEWAEYVRAHCRTHKYSAAYTAYWLKHLVCECCMNRSAAPHHIRSRGAGGDDDPGNLLALCTTHHTEAHQLGVGEFGFHHGHLHRKIEAALARPRGVAK